MVTRTITSTEATVMVLDLEKCEPRTDTHVLAGKLDEKAILKEVATKYDLEKVKPVHVTSIETLEKVYGLSEDDFMKSAQELDPQTRKPIVTVE